MMPSRNSIIKLSTNILIFWLSEVSSEGFPELFCNFSPCTINITVINNLLLSTFLKKLNEMFNMKDWLDDRVKVTKARLVFESNLSLFYYINLLYLLIIIKTRWYVDARFIMNLILLKTYLITRKSLSL